MKYSFLICFAFLFVDKFECKDGLPENIAVYIGQPAELNCTIFKDSTHDTFRWMFYQTQTFQINHISTNGNVDPFWEDVFEIDSNENVLKIKSVDKRTAGLYECSAYRNLTTLEYHLSFVHAIDNNPSCAQSAVISHPDIPQNSKIAYCYSNYTARWPPNIKLTPSSSDVFNSAIYQEGDVGHPPIEFTAGMCAIIDKDANFDCSMSYGSPPSYTIISENTNLNEMTLTTQCSSDSSSTDDNVPDWLKEDCLLGLRPSDYTKRPRNIAVLKGSSTILNCSAITSGKYDRASWLLSRSQSDTNAIVAENYNIEPSLSNLYRINGFGNYDLEIKNATELTTGLYQCSGFNTSNNFENYYKAFVSAISKPKCYKTKYSSLPSNSRLAFCHVEYASSWAPDMKVLSNDNSLNVRAYGNPVDGKFYEIGQCGLLSNSQSRFNCTISFPPPPDSLLVDESFDRTQPDLVEICEDSDAPLSDVPSWLVEKCERDWRLSTLPPATTPAPTKKPRPHPGAPKNIAVAPSSTTQLDCAEIGNAFPIRSWFLVQSQSPSSFTISTGMTIVDGFAPFYEFRDTNVNILNIKDVTELTAGLYDCSGAKQVGNEITFEYYTAFVNVLDEPKCAEDHHVGLNDGKKLIYCYVKYGADWMPEVNLTIGGQTIANKTWNKFEFSLEPVYSQIGGCAIVDKNVNNFGCTVKFNEPPSEIVYDDYYDKDAPDYTRSCETQSNLDVIPSWLKEECAKENSLTTIFPPTNKPTTIKTTQPPMVSSTTKTTAKPPVVSTRETTTENHSTTLHKTSVTFIIASIIISLIP